MTFESRLEHLNTIRNEVAGINLNQASINFTQRPGSNNYHFKAYKPNSGGRFSNYNNYRGGRRARNRGGGFNSSDRPVCQVCGKIGHKANICNFRYDECYTGSPNQRTRSYSQPTALVASPSSVNDPAWFADTRASNHVTAKMGNINSANDFTGKEKIMVGN